MHDLFTKDIGWKLASLILAVIIWVTVFEYSGGAFERGMHRQNTYSDLPVSIFSSTSDARSFHIKPDTVTIKVSGPADVMATLQGAQIHPFVDITGNESARSFRRPVNVSLPQGVTLDDADPSWVGVESEAR